MSYDIDTPDKEAILATLVHSLRGLNKAIENNDRASMLIYGTYFEGCRDMLSATLGKQQAKAFLRNASAVVEKDECFSVRNCD